MARKKMFAPTATGKVAIELGRSAVLIELNPTIQLCRSGSNPGWFGVVLTRELYKDIKQGVRVKVTDQNATKISVEGSRGHRANRDDSPTY